jgi:hypothetical protein
MDMSDTRTWKRYGGAAGRVASGLVAGGVLAGTLTATAAEDTTAGTAGSTSRSAEDTRPERPVEEALTGDVASQVEAAVLAEYPGATIERSETDSGGVYEAHIVTADGERLTVLVGEDFTVTGTETGGPGRGGRGGAECDEDGAAGEQPTDGAADEQPAEGTAGEAETTS